MGISFDPQAAAGHSPKAVIFDIGRVIVRLQPERTLEPLATRSGQGLSPEQLWSAILHDPLWENWQEGRMEPREWHQHLSRQLDIKLGFQEFCAAWNGALHPETILKESLFAKLAARCRLAVLSNTDPLHSAALEAQFTFLRHFPVRIYSCRIGASKPAPAIYQAALRAVGVQAAEALYIDDIAEYVQAARKIGLDAIRFENPAQLSQELSRRGLPGD
ncbi:MAG TPA: HAD family phosphatase [Anaerolineales bacterium]